MTKLSYRLYLNILYQEIYLSHIPLFIKLLQNLIGVPNIYEYIKLSILDIIACKSGISY